MLTIVAVSVSCEETDNSGLELLGSANVHVRLIGDAANKVERVELTLTGVDISPAIFGQMKREDGSWFADIKDIPAGVNNRIVRATAFDSSGVSLAELSIEQVTITNNRSAEVFLYLDTGVRNAQGSGDSGPVIDGLSASSAEAYTDEVITFTVSSHDPGSNDALRYTWSADGGFFYSASSAIVSWNTPSRPGRYKIWVTVTDSTGKQVSQSIHVRVVNMPPLSF